MPKKTRKTKKKTKKKTVKRKKKRPIPKQKTKRADLKKKKPKKTKEEKKKPTIQREQPDVPPVSRQLSDAEILLNQLKASANKYRKHEIVETILRMPEPFKYSTIFVILSIITIFFGMFFVSLILALTNNPAPSVSVQANATDSPTTTTSSTSTTIYEKTTSSTTTSTTQKQENQESIICSPPYIRFGLGCCLDVNENSICDKDESGSSTTTTLSEYIRCVKDKDCGPTRIEYKCYENNVIKLTVAHFCRNPGTRASTCETNLLEDVVEECKPHQRCYVDSEGNPKCQKKHTANNFLD